MSAVSSMLLKSVGTPCIQNQNSSRQSRHRHFRKRTVVRCHMQRHSQGKRVEILLFGDSMTEFCFRDHGWGALLADLYARKGDVISRGFRGYNTRWALHLLPYLLDSTQPPCDLATVFFGANDCASVDGPDARQHVPLYEYKENLTEIVESMHASGIHNVMLITPPPIAEIARLKEIEEDGMEKLDRTFASSREYALACKEVSEHIGCPVVDLWGHITSCQTWEQELSSDGVHFTPKGNGLLLNLISSCIQHSFPEIWVDALQPDFPAHDDIDHLDSAAAFQRG